MRIVSEAGFPVQSGCACLALRRVPWLAQAEAERLQACMPRTFSDSVHPIRDGVPRPSAPAVDRGQRKSGATLRKAERTRYGGDCVVVHVFDEPPRLRFWYEPEAHNVELSGADQASRLNVGLELSFGKDMDNFDAELWAKTYAAALGLEENSIDKDRGRISSRLGRLLGRAEALFSRCIFVVLMNRCGNGFSFGVMLQCSL